MDTIKYKDIETGDIYSEITPFIYYNFSEKNIIIARAPTDEEELGIPTNNDFPYGQPEVVDLEIIQKNDDEDENRTIVIQERVRVSELKKYLAAIEHG